MGGIEKAGGQFATADRAGGVGARQTERIEGPALVIETGGEKPQGRVFAENRVAAQHFVAGNVKRVAFVEPAPAGGTNEGTFAVGFRQGRRDKNRRRRYRQGWGGR
jgi:hypothetical protein